MQKSFTVATKVEGEMAAANATYFPVEIGTRGTVGSLIMKEIEHFTRMELSRQASAKKPSPHCSIRDAVASSSGHHGATERKKKRGRSKLLPRMCSMVEISEIRPVGVSGFGYRNLKSDVKKLQV